MVPNGRSFLNESTDSELVGCLSCLPTGIWDAQFASPPGGTWISRGTAKRLGGDVVQQVTHHEGARGRGNSEACRLQILSARNVSGTLQGSWVYLCGVS